MRRRIVFLVNVKKNLVEEPEGQRFSVPSYLILRCGKLMHWSTHETNHLAAVLFA